MFMDLYQQIQIKYVILLGIPKTANVITVFIINKIWVYVPLSSNVLWHGFTAVLESCDLPHLRFHDLRHTNATLMLRNAVPAKIVSSMLGHSSIGITMDIYSHVVTDMQEGAVGVMDNILNPSC